MQYLVPLILRRPQPTSEEGTLAVASLKRAPAMAKNVNIQKNYTFFHGIQSQTKDIKGKNFSDCMNKQFPFAWRQFYPDKWYLESTRSWLCSWNWNYYFEPKLIKNKANFVAEAFKQMTSTKMRNSKLVWPKRNKLEVEKKNYVKFPGHGNYCDVISFCSSVLWFGASWGLCCWSRSALKSLRKWNQMGWILKTHVVSETGQIEVICLKMFVLVTRI